VPTESSPPKATSSASIVVPAGKTPAGYQRHQRIEVEVGAVEEGADDVGRGVQQV
jgi:hypothetical protein